MTLALGHEISNLGGHLFHILRHFAVNAKFLHNDFSFKIENLALGASTRSRLAGVRV